MNGTHRHIKRPIKGRLIGDTSLQQFEEHLINISLLNTSPIRWGPSPSRSFDLLVTTIGNERLMPKLIIQGQPRQPISPHNQAGTKGLVNDLCNNNVRFNQKELSLSSPTCWLVGYINPAWSVEWPLVSILVMNDPLAVWNFLVETSLLLLAESVMSDMVEEDSCGVDKRRWMGSNEVRPSKQAQLDPVQ